ncbi:MAG: hypothetical protein IT200_12975 [Thermoleophilia bacterium]|nr:hypothetical protein [Thermoleophilia bacterium]
MLGIDCPHCGPTLVWESRLSGFENTPAGILVRFRCYCGHEGTMLTGRRRRAHA